MPLIRTYNDIEEKLGNLTPAEARLMTACREGEPCVLGDTVPPEGTPSPDVHIRADLLRYLITGGCDAHPVADQGVDLYGAFIAGTLDLNFATACGETTMMDCRFENAIEARQAKLNMLILNCSEISALDAEGAQVTGHVLLRAITANAQVRLSSATIGGQLDCEYASFNATEGHALNAQGAQVTGDVFLREITAGAEVRLSGATIGGQLSCTGASFKATEGEALNAQGAQVTGDVFLRDIATEEIVNLNAATIGGQLDCEGASFNAATGFALNAHSAQVTGGVFLRKITAKAEVSLSGATIGGVLVCDSASFNATDGLALNAQGARVKDSFFFRNVTCEHAMIYLRGAHAGTLADDPKSWPPSGRLVLEGFTYDQIVNTNFPKLSDRLDWLAKGNTWGREFFPQPYTQLAKVYREMGRDGDGRDVLYERERRLLWHRSFSSYRLLPPELVQGKPRAGVQINTINFPLLLWSFLARTVVGYGYYPFRSVVILLVLIGLSAVFANRTWQTGDFAPNSAHILISPDWRSLQAAEAMPARVWSGEIAPEDVPPASAWSKEAPGRDWETFNALAYGADIAIPLIEFGQTDAWAPSTSRGNWGKFLWGWRWVATVTGWIVTGLAAAAVTGIIRRD